jgi:hypothetical protein
MLPLRLEFDFFCQCDPCETFGGYTVRITNRSSPVMPSNRRTEFAAFMLDLLDFMEEKIREAIDDECSRSAAISEAAGAVPVLRDRLRENEVAQAQFMLVFDAQMFDADAAKWWSDLEQMDRTEFEKLATDLVGPKGTLVALRKVAETSATTS